MKSGSHSFLCLFEKQLAFKLLIVSYLHRDQGSSVLDTTNLDTILNRTAFYLHRDQGSSVLDTTNLDTILNRTAMIGFPSSKGIGPH
jgi:hypothetical protein